MDTQLFITTIKDTPAYTGCNGCGHKFEPEEKYLCGIESDYSQSWSCFCKRCVSVAVKLMFG